MKCKKGEYLLQVNEEDDYDDKLKISDSAIELDNIETLDDPALNNIEILA